MSLEVLTGTADAGKTGVLYERLRDRIASGGRALLLVPSPSDATQAMAELASACPAGLEIATLGAHLDACWRAVGDGRRLVTPVQRAIILEEAGSAVDLGGLTGSASTPGFRRMLAGLVQRAAESDQVIEPEGFDSHVGTCLVRIVRAYFESLQSSGLIERAEAYRLVTASVDSLDLPALVALNRFTGLTLPQEQYISALSARREVVVTLTYSDRLPATEAAATLVARLASLGTVVEVRPAPMDTPVDELRVIEQSFSAAQSPQLTSDGKVIVSESWGRSAEAARVVDEIQHALLAGITPGDIAVVFRDPAAHLRPLRFALDEAAIRAEWDLQMPFERTGLGRAMIGLLAVCGGLADRAAWMDLMRSPYSPATSDELDALDARIRRRGIRGVDAARLLESWAEGSTAAFLRAAREAYGSIALEDSGPRWHALAMTMMGRAHPKGRELAPEGLLDAAAARALMDAVEGLNGASDASVPAPILIGALRDAPVSVSAVADDASIQVMSAERIRGRRYRCVIVGGLTAGEFPRVSRDSGHGGLGVDAILESAGIDISSRDDVAAERLLFYQVITRARDRLVLSRRSHDDLGQPLQPSIFFQEVLDLYGDRGGEGGVPESFTHRTVLGLDAGCCSGGAPVTARRTARSDALRLAPGARISCGSEPIGERPEPPTADDGERAALSRQAYEALSARDVFSVSEIETYLHCPYRWFIERVIKPSDLDARVDASTAGQAAHDVLARVYDRFVSVTGLRRVTPESLAQALDVLPVVADEVLASIRPESTEEAAALRRAVGSTAGVIAADAVLLPGFEPSHREWSFGMSDADAPEPFDGYALRGRIDRIDCSASHVFITDYKLGSIGPERGVARFEEQGLVQLPLYAHVASQRLGLDVAGAVYRSITRGQLRGFVVEGLRGKPFVSTDVVDPDGVKRVLESAHARAAEAVRGMRAGDIQAAPSGGRCSPYCDARLFCPGRGTHHA